MLAIVTTYAASLVVFLGLDAVWLSLMGPRLYKPLLRGLLAETVNPVPAVVFYLIYIAGILVLAIAPWSGSPKLGPVVARGAVLGLVAYATYDLTNQATLKNWPTVITLSDLCWGAIVTAAAAGAGCLAWKWITG
ncbi:DUF2177 family protein [Acidisoma sp. 7E03]